MKTPKKHISKIFNDIFGEYIIIIQDTFELLERV